MKIALDTNLIVRLIVDDDTAQVDRVERLLDLAEEAFISMITLCEVVWVLRRSYRLPASAVSTALRSIAGIQSVTLDRQAFEAGLGMFEAGGDFADGCVLFEARRAKCDQLATFDKTFVSLSAGFASPP
ncbi:MAG: type II toxin-antitoxin system VapC family toxin [Gemmatimonadaceae bacterium]|nr:type II toxin-antitoxin system VapC family toxin [Caulobacter sp.]